MKARHAMVVAILAGAVWMPVALEVSLRAQALPEKAFAEDLLSAGIGADTPQIDISDYSLYQEGNQAISAGRWSDAVTIFSKIVDQKSVHAQGALYWKAYAENKQGLTSQAMETCGQLRKLYDGSSWNDECGALEIEILDKSGKPIHLNNQLSDDLKVLALNALMQRDEKRATAEIEQILNGDSSEKLKQGALFILSQHHTDTVYPQVVRVSYVEGDVRVTRGEENKKSKDATWEKAAADLPLASGFSLVTGEGRAEIEFENASTLYLGENSVLTLNDLHTWHGTPYTEIALLSGTITLHVRPYVAGEVFTLHTPTDTLTAHYPQAANLRVTSYVDGIAITSAGQSSIGLEGAGRQPLPSGVTHYFKEGKLIMVAGPIHAPDFTAWDQWVAARYAQYSTAQAALTKEAGLNSPIPGLAQMQGQGTFYKCAPYGTCWEPKVPPQTETAATPQPESRPEANGQALTPQSQPSPGQTAPPARNIQFIGKPMPNAGVNSPSALYALMPCFPWSIRSLYYPNPYYPWEWAVCNSGSWIYDQNRYVWVAGRCHHHPPIHWVKYGKATGFVPVHPHDLKDRPPVNGKNGVFAVNLKANRPIEHLPTETGKHLEVMREPPKSFRVSAMPLAPAGEPHLEVHQVKDTVASRGTPIKTTGIPMIFDHRSQSFVLPTQVSHGGHNTTVVTPVSNRDGSLQAHGGSYAGGGGHSIGGGGGAHGGGGGASGGGASHSSGGSSGGGGSHSSGGGSSSGGASSSASSGGGSHH